MNLESLFEKRNRSLARINEGVDYLSRVVRENLSVFDIDNTTGKLTLMSETGAFIKCSIASEDTFVFEKFEVGHVNDIFSDEKVDEYVKEEVSVFVRNLSENSYDKAESIFDNILNAFRYRNRINETRYRLEKAKERFGASQDIIGEPEFAKLMEIKDSLKEAVQDNIDVFAADSSLSNGVKLSNAVKRAYNLPYKTWSELADGGSLELPANNNGSLYEMICGQELIRKELLTAKDRFSGSWVNNESISTLASCIYGSDEVISEAIQNAVTDIPYFALASKNDIHEVISAVYDTVNPGAVTKKDIKDFVAKVFEAKKSSRELVTETLSKHYGISLQNLKFVPSFSNLAKANADFLEKATDKLEECVAKDVLKEFKKFITSKSGVQVLDVNDYICDVFGCIIPDEDFMKPVNLTELSEKISNLFIPEAHKVDKGSGGQYKGDDEVLGDDVEDDKGETEEPKNGKKSKKGKKGKKEKNGDSEKGGKEDKEKDEAVKGFGIKEQGEAVAPAGALPTEEAPVEEEEPGPATTTPQPQLSDDQIKSLVTDLEDLFSDIDFEDAATEEEEESPAEMEEGERMEAQAKVAELTAELEQAAAEAEEMEMRAVEGGLDGDVDDEAAVPEKVQKEGAMKNIAIKKSEGTKLTPDEGKAAKVGELPHEETGKDMPLKKKAVAKLKKKR